jgi:hypothetical protein
MGRRDLPDAKWELTEPLLPSEFVALDIERQGDVTPHEFERQSIALVQMADIVLAAGKEIVDAHDIMPVSHQIADQVRPEKACAADNN